MGNHVAVAQPGLRPQQIPGHIEQSAALVSAASGPFSSCISIWRIAVGGDGAVLFELHDLRRFKQFDPNSCFLVLHTHRPSTASTRLTSAGSTAPAPASGGLSSVGDLADTISGSLTPRGINSRFCGGSYRHSHDDGEVPAVDHDIYVWNGRDAAPVTRACALARGFELEKELERLRESSRSFSRELSFGSPDPSFAAPLSELFPGSLSQASIDAALSGQGPMRRLCEAAASVSHVPAPAAEVALPSEPARKPQSTGGRVLRHSFSAARVLFFAANGAAPSVASAPSEAPSSASHSPAPVPTVDNHLAPSTHATYAQIVARSPEPTAHAPSRVAIPRLALGGNPPSGAVPPVRRLSGPTSPHSPEPPVRQRPGFVGSVPPVGPPPQAASPAVRASPRTPRGGHSRPSPRTTESAESTPRTTSGPPSSGPSPRTASSNPSPRVPPTVPESQNEAPNCNGATPRGQQPPKPPVKLPLSLSLGAARPSSSSAAPVPPRGSGAGTPTGGRAVLASRAGPPPALDLAALQNGRAELTERQARKLKFEHFNRICSQITEFLYLASNDVASNRATLNAHGITHVLNCAGGDCAEHFHDELVYRTLYLSDSPNEDISCYFYDVIEFIDAARKAGGRVLVHCYQGVSRSSSMVICYLMYSQGWRPYDEVYQSVKEKRGICNPNTGFVCQLLQWRKRCIEGLPEGSPPRLYLTLPVVLGPGQHPPLPPGKDGPVLGPGDAVGIVSREVSERDRANSLDTRGCAVLLTAGTLYLWRGAKCHPRFRQYTAERLVPRLTRFERAPARVEEVLEGREPAGFWEALGGRLQPGRIPAYDSDLDAAARAEERSHRRVFGNSPAAYTPRSGGGPPVAPSPKSPTPPPSAKRGPASPALFMAGGAGAGGRESRGGGRLLEWPSWEPLDLFDTDDLADDKLFCLLVPPRAGGPGATPPRRPQARVWVGDEFDVPEGWEAGEGGGTPEAERAAFARAAGLQALERLGLPEAGVELIVELQGQERDDFWAFFELG